MIPLSLPPADRAAGLGIDRGLQDEIMRQEAELAELKATQAKYPRLVYK